MGFFIDGKGVLFFPLRSVVSLDSFALSYNSRTTVCVKQLMLISVVLALSGLAWIPQCPLKEQLFC